MGINLYTLEELNNIGNSAIKSNLPELDPTVPGSFVRALVSANAILIYAAQRNITEAQKDFFPQTAEGEFLDFWAEINALTRVPGTIAEGKVSMVGTLTVSIPEGTIFASTVGNAYVSTSAASIAAHAGSVTLSKDGTTITAVTAVAHSLVDGLLVTISGAVDPKYDIVEGVVNVLDNTTFTYTAALEPDAVSDSGAYSSDFADIPVESVLIGVDKNLVPGALLTLASTVIGVDSSTQVTVNGDGLTAGSDVEDDDSLRERVLLANAIDPGVFTSAQIRLDALSIPSATRVFITNPSVDYTTDGVDVENRSVTSITQAAGVATALISDTSNIFNGSTVTISGASEPEYNGDVTILSLVEDTSFTFSVDSGAASPAGGTILLNLDKLKNIPIPGVVYVFVLDDSNDPPTPSATTLTNVKNEIIKELPAHTPKNNVVVVAPFFETVAITITNLSPNTSAMQIAINNSLAAFFEDSAVFAEPIKVNQIIAAIQNTQDLESKQFVGAFTLTSPASDVEIGNGSLGTLGVVNIS